MFRAYHWFTILMDYHWFKIVSIYKRKDVVLESLHIGSPNPAVFDAGAYVAGLNPNPSPNP